MNPRAASCRLRHKDRDLNFEAQHNATDEPSGPPPMPTKLPGNPLAKTLRQLPVLAMAASPTAPLLAVAGQDMFGWSISDQGNARQGLPFPEGEPHVLRFSRNGKVLLAAGGRPVQSGRVVLFDVAHIAHGLATIGDGIDEVLAAV